MIRKLVADQGAANHPLFVFTFGTPLENQEHFHLNFFYRLLSRARFLMRTLEKASIDIAQLDRINRDWQTTIGAETISKRYWFLFGLDDARVIASNESEADNATFIPGSHVGIVSPGDSNACAFVTFKDVLMLVPT